MAEEPLLAQGDWGRAFQGLRGHSEGICFGLKHSPHKTQLSPPAAAALLPRGSLALRLPPLLRRSGPRLSPDQPLLLRAAGDWRAGGGPGRGRAPFIPRRSTPPGAEKTAPAREEHRASPPVRPGTAGGADPSPGVPGGPSPTVHPPV